MVPVWYSILPCAFWVHLFSPVASGLCFYTIIVDVSCCLVVYKEELIGSGPVCQREQTLEDSGYVSSSSFPEG